VATGQLVGYQKADVVAGAFVGTARVAEANDEGGPFLRSPPEPLEKGARQSLCLEVLSRGALSLLG
jgi:hypothetical protein